MTITQIRRGSRPRIVTQNKKGVGSRSLTTRTTSNPDQRRADPVEPAARRQHLPVNHVIQGQGEGEESASSTSASPYSTGQVGVTQVTRKLATRFDPSPWSRASDSAWKGSPGSNLGDKGSSSETSIKARVSGSRDLRGAGVTPTSFPGSRRIPDQHDIEPLPT